LLYLCHPGEQFAIRYWMSLVQRLLLVCFFFHLPGCLSDLHSFPTRRSSDLLVISGGHSSIYDVRDRVITMLNRTRDDAIGETFEDRKSTRLNSSHLVISYAVFCLKKKTR